MIPPSPRLKREFSRFLKFLVVGTIGAIVDFGTFNLLTSLLGLWSIPASALSFTAAISSNFIWNYYWTYPDSRSKPLGKQAVQFALVNLVGLAIRTPVFGFSEGPFIRLSTNLLSVLPATIPPGSESIMPLSDLVLGRNLALALAVIIVLFWNFAINRFWTYSDVE
jgi:putative flippase GtrA